MVQNQDGRFLLIMIKYRVSLQQLPALCNAMSNSTRSRLQWVRLGIAFATHKINAYALVRAFTKRTTSKKWLSMVNKD